jgi:molybdate transport system substrate-binding protein
MNADTSFFRFRSGSAAQIAIAALVAVVVIGLLWFGLMRRSDKSPENSKEPLLVFCAASNQPVFEAIRRDYEQATGVPIQVQYGASQTLLAGIDVSRSGDLYLPADDSYLTVAREKGLAGEVFPLASMKAVVAVAKGNPKKITKWNDLLQPGIRLAQATPDAAAIGKLTRSTLLKSGLWETLDKYTTVYASTVAEAANNLKAGGVDAAIIYDSMLHDYDTLEAVSMPELNDVQAKVAATVLTTSRQSQRALDFARYLSAPDKGLVRYREFGFVIVDAKAK